MISFLYKNTIKIKIFHYTVMNQKRFFLLSYFGEFYFILQQSLPLNTAVNHKEVERRLDGPI